MRHVSNEARADWKVKIRIRKERAGDAAAIRRINLEAFKTPAEADLVERLRAAGALSLSLVAEERKGIAGHIAFSPVVIEGKAGKTEAVGLGPMSVKSDSQGEGIGSSLVVEGIERLRRAGHGAIFVLGHSCYYPRFGFLPSWRRGLYWEHKAPEEAFMVLELSQGYLEGIKGKVCFHPLFEGLIP